MTTDKDKRQQQRQDTKYKTTNNRHKTRDIRQKTQDKRYKTKDTKPETIDTRHGKYRVLELRQRTEHRGPWTHLTNNILDTDSE